MKRLLPAWPGGASATRVGAAGPLLASDRPVASRAAVAVYGQPPRPASEFALALVDACRVRGRQAWVLIGDGDVRANESVIARLRSAGARGVTSLPEHASVASALAACPSAAPVVGIGAAFAEACRSLLTVEVGAGIRAGHSRPGVDLALTRPSREIAEQVAAWLVDGFPHDTGLSAP